MKMWSYGMLGRPNRNPKFERKESAIEALLDAIDVGPIYKRRIRRDLETQGRHVFDRRLVPYVDMAACGISEVYPESQLRT